jgi:hypothetical protein
MKWVKTMGLKANNIYVITRKEIMEKSMRE